MLILYHPLTCPQGLNFIYSFGVVLILVKTVVIKGDQSSTIPKQNMPAKFLNRFCEYDQNCPIMWLSNRNYVGPTSTFLYIVTIIHKIFWGRSVLLHGHVWSFPLTL